jgi:hypothetical protein
VTLDEAALLRAIEYQISVARAASVSNVGVGTVTGEHWHWTCSSCDVPIPITDVTIMDEVLECPHCKSVGVGLRSIEEYRYESRHYSSILPHLAIQGSEEVAPAVGAHIALNDPATTIRRCEEDLAVLARHSHGGDYYSDDPHCTWCEGHHWPCPDVASVARRYQLLEDKKGEVQ